MKIMSIIGARPHYMKLAPLIYETENHSDIDHILVDSGQHYDNELSSNFLLELNIKQPDYSLQIGSGDANLQIGQILIEIDDILKKERPDIVFVYGDTNTTAAGAIAAAKQNILLAHIEAGLREWDKSIPEETNKLITDALSDFYFCPSQTALENLQKQGIYSNVFLVGDTTLDLLKRNAKYLSKDELIEKHNMGSDFHLFTCHRASNTDNPENIREIVDFINHTDFEIIWPMHPRMKHALLKKGWTITNPKVHICPPLGYWETQSLIKHSRAVITDSGGIIKEAYFHETPAVIIDKQTEWIETVEEGWHQIAGPNKNKIEDCLHKINKPKSNKNAYGKGDAAFQIISIIKKSIMK